jgi:hypothetical protein
LNLCLAVDAVCASLYTRPFYLQADASKTRLDVPSFNVTPNNFRIFQTMMPNASVGLLHCIFR